MGVPRRRAQVAGRVAATAAALATVGALAAGASASGALPVSPIFLGSTAADHALAVRPTDITYTGDGTGFLGGAHARGLHSAIHWTKWTTSVAVGSGYNQLDNCVPDCASGRFHGYAVKIELWRPRRLAGTLVFTRMTIFYKHGRPAGEPRHYTFTDLHTSGGYGWGPPSAQGYCIHTFGQPPAAGCRNIHALP
ncbi:MAG TPA: hypothetical protein VE992_02830 [Solirubrobacteraceae bacterium]|nr:hypothetical protein [Solirubrobacteraceae bacterium]